MDFEILTNRELRQCLEFNSISTRLFIERAEYLKACQSLLKSIDPLDYVTNPAILEGIIAKNGFSYEHCKSLQQLLERAKQVRCVQTFREDSKLTREHLLEVDLVLKANSDHQVLGLAKASGFSTKDVKLAYHSKSRKVHPDKNPAQGSNEAFNRVKEAFERLQLRAIKSPVASAAAAQDACTAKREAEAKRAQEEATRRRKQQQDEQEVRRQKEILLRREEEERRRRREAEAILRREEERAALRRKEEAEKAALRRKEEEEKAALRRKKEEEIRRKHFGEQEMLSKQFEQLMQKQEKDANLLQQQLQQQEAAMKLREQEAIEKLKKEKELFAQWEEQLREKARAKAANQIEKAKQKQREVAARKKQDEDRRRIQQAQQLAAEKQQRELAAAKQKEVNRRIFELSEPWEKIELEAQKKREQEIINDFQQKQQSTAKKTALHPRFVRTNQADNLEQPMPFIFGSNESATVNPPLSSAYATSSSASFSFTTPERALNLPFITSSVGNLFTTSTVASSYATSVSSNQSSIFGTTGSPSFDRHQSLFGFGPTNTTILPTTTLFPTVPTESMTKSTITRSANRSSTTNSIPVVSSATISSPIQLAENLFEFGKSTTVIPPPSQQQHIQQPLFQFGQGIINQQPFSYNYHEKNDDAMEVEPDS